MILPRDLTKLEKEKLGAMREELLGKLRKRVTPVFKRADGTIEKMTPKLKSPWQWMFSPSIGVPHANAWHVKIPAYMAPSLQEIRQSDIVRATERLNQLRGITHNTFLQRIINEMVSRYTIGPLPLGRGTVEVIPPPKASTVEWEWVNKKPSHVDVGRPPQLLLCDKVSA